MVKNSYTESTIPGENDLLKYIGDKIFQFFKLGIMNEQDIVTWIFLLFLGGCIIFAIHWVLDRVI